ncbi:MAG: hypothetical protein IJ784_09885 [Ruminiclostridium sp.]|nr:hypothetical protein [Ruminiclostridium sp.]
MSYDIKVLSAGASCKLNMTCGSIIAERTGGFGKAFRETYIYASKITGEWFELVKEGSPKILGSFDVCDFDFDGGEHEPSWRTGKAAEGHYSLVFRSEELFSDFRLVMRQLRNMSPSKTLIFLARLQDNEQNDVCGVLTLDEFLALIPEKRIYSNICYIIQN